MFLPKIDGEKIYAQESIKWTVDASSIIFLSKILLSIPPQGLVLQYHQFLAKTFPPIFRCILIILVAWRKRVFELKGVPRWLREDGRKVSGNGEARFQFFFCEGEGDDLQAQRGSISRAGIWGHHGFLDRNILRSYTLIDAISCISKVTCYFANTEKIGVSDADYPFANTKRNV